MAFAVPTVDGAGFCLNVFDQTADNGFIYVSFYCTRDHNKLWDGHCLIAEESKLLCMYWSSPWHYRFN